MAPIPPKPKSIVNIDGFNFYYGAIRGTSHRWLDLQAYFTRLRQGDEVQQIYYFTALVAGATGGKQATYLRALATLPLVTIVHGKFKRKSVQCQVVGCTYAGSKLFEAQEEKRTDVNIAVQILDDAYQDRCDRFVLVSGDSDLVPRVRRENSYQDEWRIPVDDWLVWVEDDADAYDEWTMSNASFQDVTGEKYLEFRTGIRKHFLVDS